LGLALDNSGAQKSTRHTYASLLAIMLHVMLSDVLRGKQLMVQFFDFFTNNPKPDKFIDHQVKCKCDPIQTTTLN
jgi:hypothetical protein